MDREQLEFRISQYVDGTLSPAEVAALEATLASDAEARAVLEDFRKVDETLKKTEIPLPAVNWDRLAEHISAAVAGEDRATTSIPIRAWWVRRVAIAAAVLIAVGTVTLWPRRDSIASIVRASGRSHTIRSAPRSGTMARWRAPPTSTSAVSISAHAAGVSPAIPSSPMPTTASQGFTGRPQAH